MDEIDTQARKYSISNLFGGGWTALSRKFGLMLLLTLLLYMLPYAAVIGGLGTFSLRTFGNPAAQAALIRDHSGAFLLSYVLLLVIVSVHLTAMFRAGEETLAGGNPRLGEVLGQSLGRVPRVLAVTLLLAVMAFVGFLLLIVPGIIVLIRFSAAMQVAAIEDMGVFGSFRRSVHLTRGSRWRIFLAMLVAIVGIFGVELLIGIVFGGIAGVTGALGGLGSGAITPAIGLVGVFLVLLLLAFTMYLACVYASHYVELRRIREGGVTARLGDVFA